MRKYKLDFYCKNGENIAVIKKDADFTEPTHTHDCIEIVYILSGSGKHIVDGISYDVASGSIIFINYEQVHSFEVTQSMIYYNILIKPEAVSDKILNSDNAFEILSLTAFDDLRAADTSVPFLKFEGKGKILLETIIEEMYMEFTEKRCGYKAVLKGYLTVLLSYIFRRMLPQSANFKTIPYEITEYISKNLEKKLTLEELSKKCFYSPKYFGHIFKECYGITVTEYIQKKRIEESCRLLKETTLPIAEIGRRIGYDDAVRFYRYFKKFCGVTPNQYRKGL